MPPFAILRAVALRVLAIGLFAGLASLGGSAAAAETADQARLRIVEPAPLTLKGQSFKAGERVDIVVLLGTRKAARKVLAGPRGGFVVALKGFGLSRCGADLAVRARGSKGSRVSWELYQLHCHDPARAPAD
jgi:hypothetical protein